MAGKMVPLGDRVLIKPDVVEAPMKSGLIIPETAKEKPQQGVVVAVGEGKLGGDGEYTPIDLKVGDRVMFGKFSGTEVKLDDQDHLIMHRDDVLAVIAE